MKTNKRLLLLLFLYRLPRALCVTAARWLAMLLILWVTALLLYGFEVLVYHIWQDIIKRWLY